MAQRPNHGDTHPCKSQPLILYSPDHPTLYGASVPTRPGAQSEKGNLVASDPAPQKHSQDDYPDGGLQAWLVVLGASCAAFSTSFKTITRASCYKGPHLLLSFGVFTFASSIGGTVFPALFRNLLVTVGFKWTMRIIASILFLIMGITNLTIRRRLPPTTPSGGLFNAKQFSSPAFTVYTGSGFAACLGLFTGNAVGRLAGGILADRLGAINIMILASLIGGVLTFIWSYTRGTAALIALAATYGASSGAMVTLDDRPPISGAINHMTGGYTAVGIFAGRSMMVAVFLLVLSLYRVEQMERQSVVESRLS
ncbi:hypothetical protein BJY52DRAFT_1223082 [Lactarius psammicola]|nr:hypothetical protein BJY52DRAFT_1223082 [Lactarius psammicola]